MSLKQLLERERQVKIICAELNNFVDLKPTLIMVLNHIKELTGCKALGIRLEDEGDYPYYTYNDFPESFILHENSLCAKDNNGKRIPLKDRKGYLLECMCGNIIRGRFNPSLPYFSKKGSFWSNNTTTLLATSIEQDRQSRTRNYFYSCGYESVALIPIKIKGENIGLIQLNDKRKGMFTENLIEYLEMIGEQIGLAIHNSQIYTKLKNAKKHIKALHGILPICANCKKIRNDNDEWEELEFYIHEHTEADFSHGLCPDCAKELYPNI